MYLIGIYADTRSPRRASAEVHSYAFFTTLCAVHNVDRNLKDRGSSASGD